MHRTMNSLSEAVRTKSIALLGRNLALSIDLALQTKQAHWNVKGPNFIALHELFDKVSDEVREFVDLIAERITTLGGTAEGTLQAVGPRSRKAGASWLMSSRENLRRISPCHCSIKEGGTSTRMDRAKPRMCNSDNTSPASMVLPRPTSSHSKARPRKRRSTVLAVRI